MKMHVITLGVVSLGMLEATELKNYASGDEDFGKSSEVYMKNHEKFAWEAERSTAKGLKLFEKPVERMELEVKEGKVLGLHILLATAGEYEGVNYNDWGKTLQAGLGTKVKKMKTLHVSGVERSRVAWNLDKCISVYEKRSTSGKPDELWLSVYEKNAGYAYLSKAGYVGSSRSRSSGGFSGGKEGDLKDIQREQSAVVKEILARKPASGISKDSQDAVNLLNVYRYLCGVPHDVEASKTLNENAEKAAQACKTANTLSHDLGDYTNKCNLAMNSGRMTMKSSVTQYVDDRGANNRVRSCLLYTSDAADD